jgi:hypothetical protein
MIYASEAPVRAYACPSGATGPQRSRFPSEQATDRQTGYITSKLYFFSFFQSHFLQLYYIQNNKCDWSVTEV